MNKAKKGLIGSATILGAGAFIAKLLGALYRIPLTNLLGSQGLGLYQMVFPVYALLLDFSGAGVPNAIARIIASTDQVNREYKAKSILYSSLRLLFYFGIICFLIMLIFSKLIASMQGNINAYIGYIFLSPALIFVSFISCYRGYFQGLMNMKPTAISQIIEQVIKLLVGLFAVKRLMPNVALAVGGATLAITISEVVALIYLFISYKVSVKKHAGLFIYDKSAFSIESKHVLKTALPITLTGIMIPLSHLLDSFIIINLLSNYSNNATGLFGIFSGVNNTIINLPVSICYAIAMVAIPSVANATKSQERQNTINKSIILTLLISLPSAITCAVFSKTIIGILYRGLSYDEQAIASNLIRLTSCAIILLSLVQTLNGILIGQGKIYVPVFSLLIGTIIKILSNLWLLNIPSINIYGAGLSLIACYFFTCLINLIVVFNKGRINASKRIKVSKLAN